ncbi:hypothetical protein TRAPUB_2566 [Trametes pubescens]|uniref:Uncharacterized protein n=1 Tax=Trametes pubescens TaxID=154538 RepID=A0A1M2VGA2_TRAPU|nr:hypothetical protein TRAPUB_2566 [Trametes pubescens]
MRAPAQRQRPGMLLSAGAPIWRRAEALLPRSFPHRRRVAKRRAKTPKMTPECQLVQRIRHSQQGGAFRNCKVVHVRTPGSTPRRTSHHHNAVGHGAYPGARRVGKNPVGGDEAVDRNVVMHYPGPRDQRVIECTQDIYRELGSTHWTRERYEVWEVTRIHSRGGRTHRT